MFNVRVSTLFSVIEPSIPDAGTTATVPLVADPTSITQSSPPPTPLEPHAVAELVTESSSVAVLERSFTAVIEPSSVTITEPFTFTVTEPPTVTGAPTTSLYFPPQISTCCSLHPLSVGRSCGLPHPFA